MFDDIFKGTDFGNIKDEKEEVQENDVVKDAARRGIWHTGQKQDIWSVKAKDEVWDTDDLDDDCDCGSNCGNVGCSGNQDPIQRPHSSSGAFDDIF